MSLKRSFWIGLALALGTMLSLGSAAQAEMVTYSTVGMFSGGDSAGTNTYLDAAHGVQIVFDSAISSVDVPPTSQVSFGHFDTSATTATSLQGVVSGFTLNIFQSAPAIGGPVSFIGTLSGSIEILNSQAFIQFNAPLVGNIGSIVYSIASADNGTPGRVNLAPPSTNAGLTTIVGTVGVVPEPSSVVLAALLAPALLALVARTRRAASVRRMEEV
jgi:hypothetical protein